MQLKKLIRKTRPFAVEFETEALLERYYEQFSRWGLILTRGDVGVAEEIVQDLCLHLSLTSPDLSDIGNLDGYLYTSLKNMYVSHLARSSRERLRVVSVADYDTVESAFAKDVSGDLLDRQNELLQISSYVMWRKEMSKSASYLILLFFHGYQRSEVAATAILPVAAIYNKLKDARTDLREHLRGSGKLRILTGNPPPYPRRLMAPISSASLFLLIRDTIFASAPSVCLPEETLLAYYKAVAAGPLPCCTLAHAVGCERCLSLIDKYFKRPTFEDRGPLAGLEPFGTTEMPIIGDNRRAAYLAMMRKVTKRRERIRHHYPELLAIAVNGKISAYHDVQGEHSSLSSRIEHSASAQFIEVFSEQQVRLAQISVLDSPPDGAHIQTQRTSLSDDRWLELTIRFDGLGIHAEVKYFDPALAPLTSNSTILEDAKISGLQTIGNDEAASPGRGGRIARILRSVSRLLSSIASPPALILAVALVCIVAVVGYVARRKGNVVSPSAASILKLASATEAVDPNTETEHQVLRIEQIASSGAFLSHDSVEMWRDGNGKRSVRHLYNAEGQLLISEYHDEDGNSTVVERRTKELSKSERDLIDTNLWKRNISSQAFRDSSPASQVKSIPVGYELEGADPGGQRAIVSQTLLLDYKFHVVEERLHIRNGAGVDQVRFVLAQYQKVPRSSVPDSIFSPEPSSPSDPSGNSSIVTEPSEAGSAKGTTVRQTRLEIAVLYQLNRLGADVEDPIAITRISGGGVRLTGIVATQERLAQIESHLKTLPDHDLIDDTIVSQQAIRAGKQTPNTAIVPATHVYESGNTEPLAYANLRSKLHSNGLSGAPLDAAVRQFSEDVLHNAQRALQSAYALERLGAVVADSGLPTTDAVSRTQWTEMVQSHSSAVQERLGALQVQLGTLSSSRHPIRQERPLTAIESPAQFANTATKLRLSVQIVNQRIGAMFTSGSLENKPVDLQLLLDSTRRDMPLQSAAELELFAQNLSNSEHSQEQQDRSVTGGRQ